jgi:predicted XRE-type DNA-binding protein
VRKPKLRAIKDNGNVFADLGLPNPEQELLKARLTLEIHKIVKERCLTQARAGEILGIKQPHVCALMRNRAGNFPVGRLIEFLAALGQDVRITVKPTRKGAGGSVGGDAVKGAHHSLGRVCLRRNPYMVAIKWRIALSLMRCTVADAPIL